MTQFFVGVNREIVQQGVTGFLAENAGDWKTVIERLFRDSELRHSMGKAGQKCVIEHFSVDETFRKMSASLNSLVYQSVT